MGKHGKTSQKSFFAKASLLYCLNERMGCGRP